MFFLYSDRFSFWMFLLSSILHCENAIYGCGHILWSNPISMMFNLVSHIVTWEFNPQSNKIRVSKVKVTAQSSRIYSPVVSALRSTASCKIIVWHLTWHTDSRSLLFSSVLYWMLSFIFKRKKMWLNFPSHAKANFTFILKLFFFLSLNHLTDSRLHL